MLKSLQISLVKWEPVDESQRPSRQKPFVEPSSTGFIRPVLVTGRFFLYSDRAGG